MLSGIVYAWLLKNLKVIGCEDCLKLFVLSYLLYAFVYCQDQYSLNN